ncbi:MAG: DM13 domain-containing protein [Acidimicrobiia bacterium]
MATKTDERTSPSPSPASPAAPTRAPWWGWLLRALPAIAFLATFGFFFVDKSDSARTVLRSGRGLLTVAAIVGGYAVIAVALRRSVRRAWVAPLVLAGVVLGLAAWIVRPYYVDETDNTRLVEGPVVDASEAEPEAPPDEEAAPAPPPPAGPVRVSSGPIRGIDHDASGTISLIRNPDGAYIVRFESFDLEGSPDPIVYLVEGEDVQDPGGIDLGALRGNQGDVSDYAVPAGTEPGPGWTVLVWCGRLAVPIANATQAAA